MDDDHIIWGSSEKDPASCNCGCPKSIAFGQVLSAIASLDPKDQETVLKSVKTYIGRPVFGALEYDSDEYEGSARSVSSRSTPKKTTNQLVTQVENDDVREILPTLPTDNFVPVRPTSNADDMMEALKFLEKFEEKVGNYEPELTLDESQVLELDESVNDTPESTLDLEFI